MAAVLLLVGAGCSPSASEDRPEPASPVSVELSFTQWLPDEGTRRGMLRVVNNGAEPLPVTRAGLSWSGYGPDFSRPQDNTLAPGQTLDLRVLVPVAVCDQGDDPVEGILRTPTGTVRQPLTPSGQTFVRRMWRKGCVADLLAEQVAISYAPGWTLDRAEGSLDGGLVLRRRSGTEPVTVTSARGSVLYNVDLPGPVLSEPAQERTLVPLHILPGNRCDEHAIGQATAPFTFRIGVRIGRDVTTKTVVLPPQRVQQQAGRLLRLHCAGKI